MLLGLAAVAWLIVSRFNPDDFRAIDWTARALGWIGLSFFCLLVRHFCYSLRLHAITDGFFTFRKCLKLVVLWEFSSALTPTSKGGAFVMMFALTRENLAAGRTAAVAFYTMLCDSGFFVLTLPIWLAIYGPRMLYPGVNTFSEASLATGAFFVTYAIMTGFWLTMVFFLILKPQFAQNALRSLARFPFLRKFEPKFQQIGADFALGAAEIRRQKWTSHIRVMVGTLGAWTCKFIMINCIMLAVKPGIPFDGATQLFLYARLVAMFIIMSFSPTPGAAGLAELALTKFISDYIPETSIALVVALIWRGMAYYGYLLAGAIVAPAWIAEKIGKNRTDLSNQS